MKIIGSEKGPRDTTMTMGAFSALMSNFKISTFASSIPEYLPIDYKIFLVLRDFLQTDYTITLNDAVDRIINVSPGGYPDLRLIDTICFELAEQIPYHPSPHLKLARLLWLLGKNEKRIVKSRIKACIPNDIFLGGKTTDTCIECPNGHQQLPEDFVDNRGNPGDDGIDPARYVNY